MPITITVIVAVAVTVMLVVMLMIMSLGLRLALGVDSEHEGGIHNSAADGQRFSPGSQPRREVLLHRLELI
ncbi:MAG: hypothetical protein VXV94_02840, partial [Cyanobacteriota bacterium]|nr:hypothetical protein [Cyanobacteriota bacterium]